MASFGRRIHAGPPAPPVEIPAGTRWLLGGAVISAEAPLPRQTKLIKLQKQKKKSPLLLPLWISYFQQGNLRNLENSELLSLGLRLSFTDASGSIYKALVLFLHSDPGRARQRPGLRRDRQAGSSRLGHSRPGRSAGQPARRWQGRGRPDRARQPGRRHRPGRRRPGRLRLGRGHCRPSRGPGRPLAGQRRRMAAPPPWTTCPPSDPGGLSLPSSSSPLEPPRATTNHQGTTSRKTPKSQSEQRRKKRSLQVGVRRTRNPRFRTPVPPLEF
ncbi:hypothetical protein KSP40_PGU004489 [Platanthera guangdongensis]|uniref:Uncharacterized protein n=1 Tax=Platanthera guangdongensis TaxID=2320717 RepID=A0ABR2N2Y9_9ASPA